MNCFVVTIQMKPLSHGTFFFIILRNNIKKRRVFTLATYYLFTLNCNYSNSMAIKATEHCHPVVLFLSCVRLFNMPAVALYTYPDIFVNGDFFLRLQKIFAPAHSVFESFQNAKTLKRWKYDSTPYGACVILALYDV